MPVANGKIHGINHGTHHALYDPTGLAMGPHGVQLGSAPWSAPYHQLCMGYTIGNTMGDHGKWYGLLSYS